MNTRKTSVAGTFYSDDPKQLREQLKELKESKTQKDIFAIIVPHAGYAYSARTAMEAYKLIREDYKKVIILSPNHTVYTKKAVLDENDAWETPLGKIKTWKPVLDKDVFLTNSTIHKQEHAAEVHLPFLQTKLKEFKILPIIIGEINEPELNKIATQIMKIIDQETLLIISTDLSHYLTERDAKETDQETINSIIKLRDVPPQNACGATPLRIANKIFKELGKKPELLKYTTSAETTKDKNNVVGYASFAVL